MKSKWILCLTMVMLLAGLLPAAGNSQPGPDTASDLAQGDDFLVSRARSLRGSPAMAYNDDLDEYLVVWADMRQGTLYPDIYGQLVSSAGVPRGGNFVICDKDNLLGFADVAYDSIDQRYLVVWEDDTEKDIEGQLVDKDGNLDGLAINIAEGTTSDPRATPAVACYAHASAGVYTVAYRRGSAGDYNIYSRRVRAVDGTLFAESAICAASGDQRDPDVAVDPSTGNFLIVWEDGRTATDSIRGRTQDWAGVQGSVFVVSSSASDVPRYDPAVAFNPSAGTNGEWLVVFERDSSGDSQIAGRRVTAAGAAEGDLIHICDGSADQTDPDVTYNASNDQYLVVWEDARNSDTPLDIYGRRVTAAGATASGLIAICTASGSQFDPAVAASPAAPGYLVVFPDLASTIIEDISGQRVGTGGALEGHTFSVSAALGDQQRPAVAYNSQDTEFLVVWQDERAGNRDIWGQRVDLDGTLLEDNFAICTKTGVQTLPDVAYNLDTNQYLVVWEDRAGVNTDIHGQRVDADGSLDSAEFLISYTSALARRTPRVTFNPISGEYFVVYTYEGENDDVRGRRVPASSTPFTAEIFIAIGTGQQHYPDVACRTMEPGGGDYLVVWRDTSTTLQRDIKGQRLNQNGSPLGGVLDICTQAANQWSPRVAYSPDHDRYLVVWPDDRDSVTQGRDVYGRQVGGGGALHTEFAVSTASGNQAPVAVTYGGGLGNYITAWEDTRNAGTTPDIYGQRVSGTGALVDTTASTNELFFEYSGWQQFPALAWSDTEKQGLVVWDDGRNGDTFLIYGRRLANYVVYLPLVLCDY